MAQINSVTIPDSIALAGIYLPKPPQEIRKAANGVAIAEPYSSVEWTWEVMLLTDYAWWTTTLLSGAISAEYSTAQLYNYLGVLTSYTHIIVNRPTHGGFIHSALVQNVTVKLEQLI